MKLPIQVPSADDLRRVLAYEVDRALAVEHTSISDLAVLGWEPEVLLSFACDVIQSVQNVVNAATALAPTQDSEYRETVYRLRIRFLVPYRKVSFPVDGRGDVWVVVHPLAVDLDNPHVANEYLQVRPHEVDALLARRAVQGRLAHVMRRSEVREIMDSALQEAESGLQHAKKLDPFLFRRDEAVAEMEAAVADCTARLEGL